MGHNPSTNRFKQARRGVDAQSAVDEYKARSVWGAWWMLDEKVRRRYFTKDERDFMLRYGARLDKIASFRTNPNTEDEMHFLRVCMGEDEPRSPRERLWLLAHMVCRYERSIQRAAHADLAEHDSVVLRAENRALRAKADHYERHMMTLTRELQVATGERPPSICNVVYASMRFRAREQMGPPARRLVMTEQHRGAPVGFLTAAGLH